MKKVLFLMILLFLMGLGAASVKAQVRIGGNASPNAAAVLDLNADDTNTGTKGLALPRVSLTDISTPLTGTPVVNGMLVYNTNVSTTGGSGIGIYLWSNNNWKRVDIVPNPQSADSGLYLISTGTNVMWQARYRYYEMAGSSISNAQIPKTASWTIVVDTTMTIKFWRNKWAQCPVNAVRTGDICMNKSGYPVVLMAKSWGYMGAYYLPGDSATLTISFVCFR